MTDQAAGDALSSRRRQRRAEDRSAHDRASDAMLAVSGTMTAVVARTLTEMSEEISVRQLRTMVLLSSRGPLNVSTIAEHLGVNASNASRTCEELVRLGMVARTEHDEDRRHTLLVLTEEGTALVGRLLAARRDIIAGIAARMDPADAAGLADGLAAFSAAVGAAPPEDEVGLPDGRIIPWLL
ncbi:MarR family transcriptional regulator [Nocardioides sp.]|uniref:MarR family winged helix-turn-helix transcriptional regulator n=1 Tax=Nocardioides sp. TaxID=35761 RepID=UPI0025ED30AE|nr:MarR family transcriptional regulator [Nocardioides sp.]